MTNRLLLALAAILIVAIVALVMFVSSDTTPPLEVKVELPGNKPTDEAEMAQALNARKIHAIQHSHETQATTDVSQGDIPETLDNPVSEQKLERTQTESSRPHRHEDNLGAIESQLETLYSSLLSELHSVAPEKASEMESIVADVTKQIEALPHEDAMSIDVEALVKSVTD